MIFAILQLYREEAWYLERIYKWMERVGLETIRARIEDPAERAELCERFQRSQVHSQEDPWAPRARGFDAEEFQPLQALEAVR